MAVLIKPYTNPVGMFARPIAHTGSLRDGGDVIELLYRSVAELLRGGFKLRHRITLQNAEVLIDRAHDAPDLWKFPDEPETSCNAERTCENDRVRSSDVVSEAASEKAAKRSHANERHCVITHHAAALVFRNQRLDDRVARGERLHHAETDEQQRQHAEPQHVR
jgi:hypothetical protein